VVANDHVDLLVEEGEVHALLGANGAGKSTLIKMLTGVIRPDHGSIAIQDRPARVGGRLVGCGLKAGLSGAVTGTSTGTPQLV